VQAAHGHYPDAVFPVKRMIPGKALLVAIPLAVAGGWLAQASTARVGALRAELAALDEQGRAEGDSFVRTLQGAHAERQFQLLTQRHEVAVKLAGARRNQLLGVLLIVAAGLAFAFVRAAQRIAAEVEEDRRLVGQSLEKSRP
jgi:hypothetical protein